MKEWKLANYGCAHEKISKDGNVIKYMIGLYKVDNSLWRTVLYDPIGPKCTCSCGKFETYGMLCKHALYILELRVADTLPERYILKRWTIDARYGLGENDGCLQMRSRDTNSEHMKLLALQRRINRLIEGASGSPLSIAKIVSSVDAFEEEEVKRKSIGAEYNKEAEIYTQMGSSFDLSQIENVSQISVHDQIDLPRRKGQPRNASWIKSSIEIATKPIKRRTCSYSCNLGHYMTGCIIRKAKIANGELRMSTSTVQEQSDNGSKLDENESS